MANGPFHLACSALLALSLVMVFTFLEARHRKIQMPQELMGYISSGLPLERYHALRVHLLIPQLCIGFSSLTRSLAF